MINNHNKVKIFWVLFGLSVFFPLFDIVLNFFGLYFSVVTILKFCFPILILCLHSIFTFGLFNSILLIIPPFIIGLLFEILGVNFGVVFGGSYFYNPSSLGPMIFNVPVLIPFFWSFFIYTGYLITSSFLVWLNIAKPNTKNKSIWLLLLLIIIDGVIVTAIDIFMDPIMVASKNWTWIGGGVYFGIPLGNFLGWFLVTILSTGIFRVYEYYFPIKKAILSTDLLLIPIVGYIFLALIFSILAFSLGLYIIMAIGLIIMLSIILTNLYLYCKYRLS
jgi:putative membrane protein